jgi:hypothetical protein
MKYVAAGKPLVLMLVEFSPLTTAGFGANNYPRLIRQLHEYFTIINLIPI